MKEPGEPRLQREEQVQEIIELKKALAKTRQDLQKTRTARGHDRDNRSSSDEVRKESFSHTTVCVLYIAIGLFLPFLIFAHIAS